MKRLILSIAGASILAFGTLVGIATPAEAACGAAKTSTVSVNNAVPGTIDGKVNVWTSYYPCGTYMIIRMYKLDQYSGPAVRGYYNAKIKFLSGSTIRYNRTGFSISENTWHNNADFQCVNPCLMVEGSGTRSDVIAWSDGTLAVGSDNIN